MKWYPNKLPKTSNCGSKGGLHSPGPTAHPPAGKVLMKAQAGRKVYFKTGPWIKVSVTVTHSKGSVVVQSSFVVQRHAKVLLQNGGLFTATITLLKVVKLSTSKYTGIENQPIAVQ